MQDGVLKLQTTFLVEGFLIFVTISDSLAHPRCSSSLLLLLWLNIAVLIGSLKEAIGLLLL